MEGFQKQFARFGFVSMAMSIYRMRQRRFHSRRILLQPSLCAVFDVRLTHS